MKEPRYGMAPEGWPVVIALAALTGWLAMSAWPAVSVATGALLVLAVLKFRDPPRAVPAAPRGVLSPVDGVVTHIVQGPEEVHMLLRIAPLGAYAWRSPVEGKLLDSDRERGGHGVRIRTDEGEDVYLRLFGPAWLPAAAAVDYGQRIGQGQRCGLLRFACAAEIRLPPDTAVTVARGERVHGGVTILGEFPEATNGNGTRDA